MNQNQVVEIITQVTAKAQADENFKKEYVANPKKILTDAGLSFPKEINIHLIEGTPQNSQIPNSTKTDVYLLLPTVSDEIKDESLASKSSASCESTSSTCFTIPSCASCASSASSNSCS
ncbi:NHLP leader peptide family RiPP precursor [Tenacibaculum amylolyticum]|uniref:NHLP leader peptide family RiPP precursor n=1 Tax=Tenacibaculum amylolyticum TaxID=104269 RepID=UPI003895B6C5